MSDDKDDQPESEQSMEDILASIRKIISDDDDSEDGPDDDVVTESEETPDEEEDILDLGAPLEEDDFADVPDESESEDAIELGAPPADDDFIAVDPDEDTVDDEAVEPPLEPVEEDDDSGELLVVEDADDLDLVFEDAPEPEPEVAPASLAAVNTGGLLSPEAAALSASALASLRTGELHGKMGIGGGDTVEGLVAELLKPMLKQWLDIHLPSMVENLVREEIQRLQRQEDE